MSQETVMGRYGIIHLLSPKSGKAVTSFPIDTDVVTFGRDPSCDIRMYFLVVATVHCKLVFEDGKAFLSVMGENGVIVDDVNIKPSQSSGEPAIVPLTDQSRFAIHTKSFLFEYPPKELRAKHNRTPPRKSRKSIRLSMIQAAHIMSPTARVTPSSPSLEVLQSPVKPYGESSRKNERDQEVVLADGNQVLVAKQGNDLIVIETVEDDSVFEGESHEEQDDAIDEAGEREGEEEEESHSIPSAPAQIQTPQPGPSRSHSRSRISLHKAVLVRNSRLALRERDEEEEVAEVVSPEREAPVNGDRHQDYFGPLRDDDDSEGDGLGGARKLQAPDWEDGAADDDDDNDGEGEEKEGEDDDEDAEEQEQPPRSPSRIRASLEAIGRAVISPFSRKSVEPTPPVDHLDTASEEEDQGVEEAAAGASAEDEEQARDEEEEEPESNEEEQDSGVHDESVEFVENQITEHRYLHTDNDEDLGEYNKENYSSEIDNPADEQTDSPEEPHDDSHEDLSEEEDIPPPAPVQPALIRRSVPAPHALFTPQPPSRIRSFPRSSVGGQSSSTGHSMKLQPRKSRFSGFGLKDHLLASAAPEEDEDEDEEEEKIDEAQAHEPVQESKLEPEPEVKEEPVAQTSPKKGPEFEALRRQRRQSALAILAQPLHTLTAAPASPAKLGQSTPFKNRSRLSMAPFSTPAPEERKPAIASLETLKKQVEELQAGSARIKSRMSMGPRTPMRASVGVDVPATTGRLGRLDFWGTAGAERKGKGRVLDYGGLQDEEDGDTSSSSSEDSDNHEGGDPAPNSLNPQEITATGDIQSLPSEPEPPQNITEGSNLTDHPPTRTKSASPSKRQPQIKEREPPATPSFRGISHLFGAGQNKVPPTPDFRGVGDMFIVAPEDTNSQTPTIPSTSTRRGRSADVDASTPPASSSEIPRGRRGRSAQPALISPPTASTSSTTTSRATRTKSSKTIMEEPEDEAEEADSTNTRPAKSAAVRPTRSKAPVVALPEVQEDDAERDEETPVATKPVGARASATRSRKGKAVVVEVDDAEDSPSTSKSVTSKPARVTRGKAKASTPEVEIKEEEEDDVAPKPKPGRRTTRSVKDASTSVIDVDKPERRRARSASQTSVASTSEVTKTKSATNSGKRTRATAAIELIDEEPETDLSNVPPAAIYKRGSRRTTKTTLATTQEVEIVEEISIDKPRKRSRVAVKVEEEEKGLQEAATTSKSKAVRKTPVARTTRAAASKRSPVPTAAGDKENTSVSTPSPAPDEDDDVDEVVKPKPTRSTRRTPTPAITTPAEEAGPTRALRARSGKK